MKSEDLQHHKCRECGKLIVCPFCGGYANDPTLSVVYEWGNTPEETKIFCSKSCRDRYGNKRISRVS